MIVGFLEWDIVDADADADAGGEFGIDEQLEIYGTARGVVCLFSVCMGICICAVERGGVVVMENSQIEWD